MPVRSEKIETIAADNHSWNAVDINQISVVNPGSNLHSSDKSPDRVWVDEVVGTGKKAMISYQTFWNQNYDSTPGPPEEEGGDPTPSQLEIERSEWETKYGMGLGGVEGFAINVTLVEFGIGYTEKSNAWTQEASVKGLEITIRIVTVTDNGWALGNKVMGSPNSFWENNYIRPTARDFTVRALRGLDQRKLDQKGDHKMMGVHGWQYLFSNNSPIEGYKKYGDSATDTNGLQLMNDKSIAGQTSVVFGHAAAHQWNDIQRWVTPRGISFCWNNKHGRNSKSKGLRLREVCLFFKFADEKITRSVPLIENFEFLYKGQTYYDDHVSYYQSDVNKSGVVQAFMSPDDFDYLHQKNAKCIGTQMRYNYASQTTQSDNVVNIFNYRFLFSENSYPNSRMIIPSPASMKDAQYKGLLL